jgi:hypothetical protein
MKRAFAITLLLLIISSVADAQSFRHWWKHHILCMCGQPPLRGGL